MYIIIIIRQAHTLSTAFRHLPPNSARFSYATDGALFISAQLSTDAVSALRKVWVLTRLWRQQWGHYTHVNMRRLRPGLKKKMEKKKIPLDLGFCVGVNNVCSYETPDIILIVCNLLTAIWAPMKNCPLADSFPGPKA